MGGILNHGIQQKPNLVSGCQQGADLVIPGHEIVGAVEEQPKRIGAFQVGEERLGGWLSSVPVLGQAVAGLIGLIPNCAASVVITGLYLDGMISTGCMMAGLLVSAGIGVMVLFRVNHRHMKDNVKIVALLYVVGVVAGVALDLLGIVI